MRTMQSPSFTRSRRPWRGRLLKPVVAPLVAALLAACGGGGADAPDPGPASDCSITGQKLWLDDYLDSWYYWYALAPKPAPSAFADVESFFEARLYTGSDARWPADRWSRSETDESFNRFYGDGATMGFGVAVAGLEVAETSEPLLVRYVEPRSPAGLQGLQRGEEVLLINGRPASALTLANDFAPLTADKVGDTLRLRLRRDGVEREVTLTAAVYNLAPVGGGTVHTTPLGRTLGYVRVQNMISQALPPLLTQFQEFRARGVQDVVLDLRYNGGGLVSTSAEVASLVAGTRGRGLIFSSLVYNDKRAAANNADFRFTQPPQALNLPRVLLLAGRRTCSASEQLMNGLKGAGVEVVAIGETTCGKPVGSLPRSACGMTYSVINFESLNHLRQGGYYDGLEATCPVPEDFRTEQGDFLADPLAKAAAHYADHGRCPLPAAAADGRARPLAATRGLRVQPGKPEAGQRQDMVPR